MPVVLVVRGDQRVDMRKAMPLTLQSHAHYLPSCRRGCRLGLAHARCPAAAAAAAVAAAAAAAVTRLVPPLHEHVGMSLATHT